MKKTFAAFVAVATIAGSLATTPANAQRGVAAGLAAGLIGGAIVGGAIASSPPAHGRHVCGHGAELRSTSSLSGHPADASAGFFFPLPHPDERREAMRLEGWAAG